MRRPRSHRLALRRVCSAHGAGGNLSVAPDHAARAGRARRRQRHGRAHHRRKDEQAARPADRDREPRPARAAASRRARSRAASRTATRIGIGNPATLAIAPAILPNVGYDPVKDFAPVGMIAASPHIILINNFVPAKTLAEFIALAKARARQVHLRVGRRRQPGASRAGAARQHRRASSSRTCPTRAPARRSPTCSAGTSA